MNKLLQKYKEASAGKKILYIFGGIMLSPLLSVYIVYWMFKTLIVGIKEKDYKKIAIGGGLILMFYVMGLQETPPTTDSTIDTNIKNEESNDDVNIEKEDVKSENNEDNEDNNEEQIEEENKELTKEEIEVNTLKMLTENGIAGATKVNYLPGGGTNGEDTIGVFMEVQDNLTKSLIVSSSLSYTRDTIELLSKNFDNNIDTYEIHIEGNFIDKFGNETKGMAFYYQYDKETVEKINWENKIMLDFKELANRAVIHPAYQ